MHTLCMWILLTTNENKQLKKHFYLIIKIVICNKITYIMKILAYLENKI